MIVTTPAPGRRKIPFFCWTVTKVKDQEYLIWTSINSSPNFILFKTTETLWKLCLKFLNLFHAHGTLSFQVSFYQQSWCQVRREKKIVSGWHTFGRDYFYPTVINRCTHFVATFLICNSWLGIRCTDLHNIAVAGFSRCLRQFLRFKVPQNEFALLLTFQFLRDLQTRRTPVFSL